MMLPKLAYHSSGERLEKVAEPFEPDASGDAEVVLGAV
jgi:hypothetical protein